MRKGLIALALLGVVFIALMLLAPSSPGEGEPPRWTETLGRLLGGFAPRVRSLEGGTEIAVEANAQRSLDVPAAPGRDMRLLTLRHVGGGPALVTFLCRPTPAASCDRAEDLACLGLPLDPACTEQIKTRDPAEEISFTVGPGGGSLVVRSGGAAVRLQVAS